MVELHEWLYDKLLRSVNAKVYPMLSNKARIAAMPVSSHRQLLQMWNATGSEVWRYIDETG